jgi:YgiT-type zinc finger domain-containing protein
MDIEAIRERVRTGRLIESRHARNERQGDNLAFRQVEQALLVGAILEQYDDTGRGESCLVLGYAEGTGSFSLRMERSRQDSSGADHGLHSGSSKIHRPKNTGTEMKMTRCNLCGGTRFSPRRVNYLHSNNGKYLPAPNTPAEVCDGCGMEFYDADVVKEIERRFFAIHSNTETPDEVLPIPSKAFV